MARTHTRANFLADVSRQRLSHIKISRSGFLYCSTCLVIAGFYIAVRLNSTGHMQNIFTVLKKVQTNSCIRITVSRWLLQSYRLLLTWSTIISQKFRKNSTIIDRQANLPGQNVTLAGVLRAKPSAHRMRIYYYYYLLLFLLLHVYAGLLCDATNCYDEDTTAI